MRAATTKTTARSARPWSRCESPAALPVLRRLAPSIPVLASPCTLRLEARRKRIQPASPCHVRVGLVSRRRLARATSLSFVRLACGLLRVVGPPLHPADDSPSSILVAICRQSGHPVAQHATHQIADLGGEVARKRSKVKERVQRKMGHDSTLRNMCSLSQTRRGLPAWRIVAQCCLFPIHGPGSVRVPIRA